MTWFEVDIFMCIFLLGLTYYTHVLRKALHEDGYKKVYLIV